MDDHHAWTRQRLLARALATLNEADAGRFDAHVRGCDACRAELEQATAESSADPAARGHLPPAMIARWPLAEASLSGLEREAVRRHVERCDSCRAELRLLGHGAELSRSRQASAREPGHRPEGRVRPWRAWWSGGAVGALVAAILLLMLRPAQPPDAARALVALPWTAPAALRGAEVRLSVPAGTREVAVAVAVSPRQSIDTAHRIAVWGPDAVLIATLLLPPDRVVAGTAFVVLRTHDPLLPGTYRVVMRRAPAAGAADTLDPDSADQTVAEADSTESFFELTVSR